MVAGDGIEPPTRGFSIQLCRKYGVQQVIIHSTYFAWPCEP